MNTPLPKLTDPGATHTITPMEVSIVRRGEAIASVRALEETVEAQAREIAALRRQLQTCEDRLAMVVEDRHKLRADADAYRVALVELSSDMHNLHLLTERSNATREKVLAIIAREAPPENPANQPRDAANAGALRALDAALAKEAQTPPSPVPPAQSPPDANDN